MAPPEERVVTLRQPRDGLQERYEPVLVRRRSRARFRASPPNRRGPRLGLHADGRKALFGHARGQPAPS